VHADDPIVLAGGRDTCLAAELITLVYFALGQAFDFGSRDTLDSVFVSPCLPEQSLRDGESRRRSPRRTVIRRSVRPACTANVREATVRSSESLVITLRRAALDFNFRQRSGSWRPKPDKF